MTTHGLKEELDKVVHRIMEDLKGILLKNFVSKCMQFSSDLHDKAPNPNHHRVRTPNP